MADNEVRADRRYTKDHEWAKEEGVYAKGLGLLDENNWAVLR